MRTQATRFFISIAVFSTALFCSCKNGWPFCPEKQSLEYKIAGEPQNIVISADNMYVKLRQTDHSKLDMEGSSNTLANLYISNKSNTLEFSYPGCTSTHKSVTANLDVPEFSSLTVKNKSKVLLADFINPSLTATAIDATIEVKNFGGSRVDLTSRLGGKIFIDTKKKIDNADLKIESDSDIYAAALSCEIATIEINKNSNCRIGESGHLIIKGIGPGTVYYVGTPEITNENPTSITLVKIADE